MLTDVDEDYALDWRAAVEEAVHESGADHLLDSMTFLTRLDPLVGADPDAPEFARAVEALVHAYLAESEPDTGERTTESVTERISGRLLEAKGTASDGGRVFRVEIIASGQSKNGRNYPHHVLEAAVPLYEGAKAFDHHRTPQELASSTIVGLVGHYRNVRAAGHCLEGDLHLLPSATHTAEALDASIAAQAQGLPPVVGISHDAMTEMRPVVTGGKRIQEAVRITKVHSCDVVADPAAGGRATRVLAGGITDPLSNEEDDVPITSDAVLEALSTASDEQLAGVGLKRTSESTTTPAEETRTVEAGALDKGSFLGGLMIKSKIEAAGLPSAMVAQVAEALPQHVTESVVDSQIAAIKSALAVVERSGLTPTYTATVTKESHDKKLEALDGFFQGNGKGYTSFRDAFIDFTGQRPRILGADFNRVIMRESIGTGAYDSATSRTTESLDSTSWAQALGDSVTRQMIAAYALPSLQSWRRIVSRTPSVNDFRQQKRFRTGGHGLLPTVNQGAPYQPLTSPGDEEATYTLTKKGGTEDLTFEMVANDDVQAIQDIPNKLGRSAAITLYRFVWDMLKDNTTATYDSVALFHAGSHANTATGSALSQTTLTAARVAMRKQAAYGNSVELLSLVPRILVVPPELEEIAFQLSRSAVAIPSTPAGPTDTPNIHQNIEPIVIDYYTDTNDWFAIADPAMCPTIEVGFYLGRQEPELFTQADPNVGSAFNADVQTWKIRHIYNGTVIDHRSFYRGQG